MTFYDLYEACVNIDENACVYIYKGSMCVRTAEVKEVLGEHGSDLIKWFCIRYDEDIEVCFK